jgi:hypothetical protein
MQLRSEEHGQWPAPAIVTAGAMPLTIYQKR